MKSARIFKSSSIGFTLQKPPFEMTKIELLEELTSRFKLENKYKREASERAILIHELELHQLEIEIQNRELMESHKQIEESRNKYAELYDLSPAGYLTLDHRGKIIELNLTAAKLLNEEKFKLIGKCLSRWVPTDLKRVFNQHLQDALVSTEQKKYCEIEITTNDKNVTTHLQLHTQSTTDPVSLRPIFRLALLDMSDSKKAQALEAQNRELYNEKGLRENFVSHLSHDLRTPLTSSKLCAQMLCGSNIDSGKKNKLFMMLVEELDRADRMVTELLDANKIIGSKNLPLLKKRCDLAKISQKCINHLTGLYEGIKVNFKFEGEVVGMWSADALQRVIENLLHNALKYGSDLTPISLSLEGLADMVILTVHNFGKPISFRDQKKIFEAFHRCQDAVEGVQTGWGLGLNLVNNLVRNHNGNIRVKSCLTEGTSFIVELPKKS